MLNIVDQMFQYCEIPEDGQQYFFNDSIENKKIILSTGISLTIFSSITSLSY